MSSPASRRTGDGWNYNGRDRTHPEWEQQPVDPGTRTVELAIAGAGP